MDADRFDALTRAVQAAGRRSFLGLGMIAGLVGIFEPLGLEAKKRKKKKKKCKGGKKKCGKKCFALQTDPNHCGACGTACAAGQVCIDGLCWTTCPTASSCGAGGGIFPCPGGLCVAVAGVAVCAQTISCGTAIDCTADPNLCPAGTGCAAICCGPIEAHCLEPVPAS